VKSLWNKLLTHTLALVAGAAVVFLGLQVIQWYFPFKDVTAWRVARTPYNAPESSLTRGIEKVVLPTPPGGIVALKPTSKESAKLEKKLGGKLPTGPLLSVTEIKDLCSGGRVVVSLEPAANPEAPVGVVVTVYPNKARLFEWRLQRSLGLYYGQGIGELKGSVVNIEFTQDLFRVGPAITSAKAGAFLTPYGNFEYVAIGAKITF